MLPHFHLFGLEIPTFGVMMLVGMVAAFVLLYFNRRRVPFSEDDLLTMALYAIIGGFIGAKLLYWIVEFDQILANPRFLLDTLTAGFVFYGALIVGALAILVFARRRKQPFFGYVDLVAPSFILAQGFGRIGCFCAGCCYGAVCDSPLSVIYPAGSSAPAGVPLLPTQLFESAFCFVFAAVLTAIFRRQKRYGTTTGWYLVGYGVWRFIIEFFRSDDRGAVGALSTSQFIGIFIVLFGIVTLVLVRQGKTPAHIPPAAAGAAADGAEAVDGTEVAGGAQAEANTEAADGGEAEANAEAADGAEAVDGGEAEANAEAADGAETADGAEAVDGGEAEANAEAADSAQTEANTEAADGAEAEANAEAADGEKEHKPGTPEGDA